MLSLLCQHLGNNRTGILSGKRALILADSSVRFSKVNCCLNGRLFFASSSAIAELAVKQEVSQKFLAINAEKTTGIASSMECEPLMFTEKEQTKFV